ncbi:MAG TPA: DUF5996 family protein [Candidatus Baltobacteraceae bacterium]|jgi:hypothetical protein
MTLDTPGFWPALPYDEIAPTLEHLHRLAQIGAKYTLDQPFHPNWGNITLSITPRGFATPTLWAGDTAFRVEYAILDDRVTVTASTGQISLPLAAGSVADFYKRFVEAVSQLRIAAPRTVLETEIADALHFDTDTETRPYDTAAARSVWAAFACASRALDEWQAPFRGPWPPVGIMWGGFDLYAPRYNGRQIAPPGDAPAFQQNGMMAEVVAVGLSLGDRQSRAASFFAYVSPPPEGIATANFGVSGAAYDAKAGLVSLPWDTVRAAEDPRGTVVRFADAVYDVAVKLGGWPPDWTGTRHDGWYASSHSLWVAAEPRQL